MNHISAVPAYPKKVPVTIDGDTVYIKMHGDENLKFAVDDNGYTILQTDDGWFYAEESATGNIVTSAHRLASNKKMSSNTKKFLAQTPKGLMPSWYNTTKTNYHIAEQSKVPAIGDRKVLVILMQFRDKNFTKDVGEFDRLFNEKGYQEDNAIGSVYDYYHWASYGQLNLKSDIKGPYISKYEMAYYGNNSNITGSDTNPYALFLEAINEVANDVNLSEYDADNNGYVDNIHIIYAGYGEEAGAMSHAIWAHEMTFPPITMQGIKIDKYSCAPELRGNSGIGISRIGPHCHEIGHALGAMDYYDTDYDANGMFLGTGDWDVMASGSWNNDGISPADFNPYVKIYNFGWVEPQKLSIDTINIIKPSDGSGEVYRINTNNINDYYLLENRTKDYFHKSEPGNGLLIFHIGPQLTAKASANKINSTYPQQCYVVCASSNYKIPSASAKTYGDINSAGTPFPGTTQNNEFGDNSIPAALTINGEDGGFCLKSITLNGEDIFLYYIEKQSEGENENLECVWNEDFEQMRMPSSWKYTNISGSGEMSVITKLSNNDSPESPLAASGKGYLKYMASSQNNMSQNFTQGLLMIPQIKLLPEKSYQLLMKVRKYNRKDNAHDSLKIHLLDKKGVSIADTTIKEIHNTDNWKSVSFSLPSNVSNLSIGLECSIDYGSTMFIDDMSIIECNTETRIETLLEPPVIIHSHPKSLIIIPRQDSDLRIYSLSGNCVVKQKLKQGISEMIQLKSGVYIIRIDKEMHKCYVN